MVVAQAKTKRLGLALTDMERRAIRWAARKAKCKAPNGSRGDSLILWFKSVNDCVFEYEQHLASKRPA